MSVNGIGSNYCYMGAVANHVQEKVSETNAGRKVTQQPVNLSISDEGRNMLREMVNKFGTDSDYVNAREMTIQNTMLMCGKVTHKNLIDSSPYYSENQVKMNRFLKVCMIKYDYEKIDKSMFVEVRYVV